LINLRAWVSRSGVSFTLRPNFTPPALRILHPGAGAFGSQGSLKRGQHTDHLPHGAACRRLGVDGFPERLELYALLLKTVRHVNEVAHTAAQPVELSDDGRVAGLQGVQGNG
jgi:hypothetical protein